jgi:hypothetical protein
MRTCTANYPIPSWEANSSSTSQEITAFYVNWRFITVYTKARHLSLSWDRSIKTNWLNRNIGKQMSAYDPELPTKGKTLITAPRNPAMSQIALWFAPYNQLTLSCPMVTVCTAQWSLYVPHSGHYKYRTVVTICTAQWSLYVPPVWHTKLPRSAHTVYLCDLCGSENKPRLFR